MSPRGGAEEEAELGAGGGGTGDLPLRRCPLAPMSLQGNWRELGEAKLANFARDRAAERAKEERKKAQLEEPAARHIARSSEAMARISRLKNRSAEEAFLSGQEALPEYKLSYKAYMAGNRSDRAHKLSLMWAPLSCPQPAVPQPHRFLLNSGFHRVPTRGGRP